MLFYVNIENKLTKQIDLTNSGQKESPYGFPFEEPYRIVPLPPTPPYSDPIPRGSILF